MIENLIFSLVSVISLFAVPASSIAEVKEKAKPHEVVVLGGGVGALTSALYLARGGYEPLVIEGETPGGLLTQSHSVQNWPGELEIEGHALTEKIRAHAQASGAQILAEEVIGVDFSQRPFTIRTKALDLKGGERKILANSCIIAMGTTPNFLNISGEQEYWGKGVTNCAICDGSLYQNQIVGVVGGGDAAVLEALYLAKIAEKVHIFVRSDHFRATEIKRLDSLFALPNVQVHYNTEVKRIQGNKAQVTDVVLKSSEGESTLPLDGLFLAIGSKPNSQVFQNVLELDAQGYIVLAKDQETSISGIYAVGDIVDPVYKQAISASGDGAKAALQAQKFLMDQSKHLATRNLSTQAHVATLPKAEVLEIHSREQFETELRNAECPVFVDFYATWCGPCQRIAGLIETSALQLQGKVKFLKVNVDQVKDLSQFYRIQAMPTVLYFEAQGNKPDRKVGIDQIADLLRALAAEGNPDQ